MKAEQDSLVVEPFAWLRWVVIQWHNDLASGRVKLR